MGNETEEEERRWRLAIVISALLLRNARWAERRRVFVVDVTKAGG